MGLTRKEAASKIQGMFRTRLARKRLREVLKSAYIKELDTETGKFYYVNLKTGESSWEKPKLLSEKDDLDDPDTGEAWSCAYCEASNLGLMESCSVCHRSKAMSDQKHFEAAELKRKEDAEKAKREAEEADAERLRLEAEEKARNALRLPFPPSHCGARATKKGAVVWWTPGADCGKPLTRLALHRFRKDDGEWKSKGIVDVDLNECSYRFDEGLTLGRFFRFQVHAETEDGPSEMSNMSNEIEAGLVLPEGWKKFLDKSGRPYYYNKQKNETLWTLPKPDKYQVPPDLRVKFKVGEVDEFKELFSHFDVDGSGEIDKEELGQLFKRLGETLKPSQLNSLLVKVDDDGSGEISFVEFCQMMFWLREGKIGFGTKLFRGFGKLRGLGSIAKAAIGKKPESEEEKLARKMGDWEQHVNKNIGKPYYFNKKTGETTWKRPPEVLFYIDPKLRERFTEQEIEGLQEDFAAFDLDSGGSIDESEMYQCLQAMGVDIKPKKLRKMMKAVDTDGSGEIEFDEFVLLVDKMRRGKVKGMGDIFSGAGAKLGKSGSKKSGKVLPSMKADEDNPSEHERAKRKRARKVFPPLKDFLQDHALSKYEQTLRLGGFKKVETLLLLKEEDIDKLGFKTGHKRKLLAAVKRMKKVDGR